MRNGRRVSPYGDPVPGRLRNCRVCRVLLMLMTAAMVITILLSTRMWDPQPQIADWWAKFTMLSEPAPAWDARAGGAIDIAAVLDGQVVVGTRGFADGFHQRTGASTWRFDASWMLTAGDVVVLRQRPKNPDADPSRDKGYEVLSPTTGSVTWSDREAIAVWAFSDQIVDLVCPDSGDCQVRGRSHHDDGKQLWAANVPGGARTILGANPTLLGIRNPAEAFAAATAGAPGPVPTVIGLTVDGRVQIIDTIDGKRLREVTAPDRQTRLTLSSGRILLSHAEPGLSGCRYWLEALDAKTGVSQWRKDGYDLGTASGANCEQRRDPLGAAGRLVVRGADNIPTLLDVATGAPMWSGAAGERILATDGLLLVVEGVDRRTVRVIDVLAADQRAVWSGQLGIGSQATVTRELVILSDLDQGRVIVLNHSGLGTLKEIKTKATIVGYGANGLLLGSGRRIGYIPVVR
jgi:outer membrane protein assembly factor BamB